MHIDQFSHRQRVHIRAQGDHTICRRAAQDANHSGMS